MIGQGLVVEEHLDLVLLHAQPVTQNSPQVPHLRPRRAPNKLLL
uniref:Uncharacterized protein n=1 Tax=Anguilla anguilla TaxID=7936 RepID=A0A0E9UPJ3_ANGAN